jgi:hypothetical protein
MTSNVSRLPRKAGPSVDPLRAALADAVAKAKEAREALAAHTAGIQRVEHDLRVARVRVDAGEEAIEKAKRAHAAAIARAAASGKPMPVSKVKEVRQNIAEAQEEVDAAKEALDTLRQEQPHLEGDVRLADVEIDKLVSQILIPHVMRLMERGREIAAQLAPIKGILTAFWSEDDRPSGWDAQSAFDDGRKPLEETKAAVADFLRSTGAFERAARDPWAAARARLREDPHAELSELDALLGGGG